MPFCEGANDTVTSRHRHMSNRPFSSSEGILPGLGGVLAKLFPIMSKMSSVVLDDRPPSGSVCASDEEKWNMFDGVRHLVMLIVWISLWIIRLMLHHLPSVSAFLNGILASATSSPSATSIQSAEEEHHYLLDSVSSLAGSSAQPIGRALLRVLTLVNDIPVSSRKYEFTRDLADRIIQGNAKSSEAALHEINRKALSASFARTLKLLNYSLQIMQRKQKHEESSGWGSKLFNMIPLFSQLMPSFENVRSSLVNILQPDSPNKLTALQTPLSMSHNISVSAEKLAQELLWITDRLGLCSAMEEAISQWSKATHLAAFSITAPPRVQGYLVKISAHFLKEIAKDDFKVSDETKFKMLILWLPLLCYATNGIDSPVLSALERAEVEKVLERTISGFSELDQEVVLASWLNDYAFSSSDWPNLERCYDSWCQASRKMI
eukprot:TRINITY_DN35290_c0_g1_i1.p1 TRINITY_DN35290_c0_g1~~TRINITY_DN35290_c0_g1_i1.p1  ORF type:complete len:435 (-),score=61.62 TRINITY_DN35290_c0_g1_i1:248-1552(-)